VLVVPKADLLTPTPSIAGRTLFERAQLATTGFSPQPVNVLDDSAPPRWMISSAFIGVIQSAVVGGDPEAPTLAKGAGGPW
jgi:hypothetical protein